MSAFSIKKKLMLITMVSSTAALLLVAIGFITYEYITFREMMKRDLATQAGIIGHQSTAALTFEDRIAATEYLRALSAKSGIVVAALYNNNGLLALYRANGPTDGPAVPNKPMPEGQRFTREHLELFKHIAQDGETLGAIYLRSDLKELHARLSRYALIMLVFMLGSLGVTYSLASKLQRIISRPIFHLAQTAKTVSLDKNYSVRASKETNDELGQLIDGFNEMLAQIQERDGALHGAKDELEKRVQERTQDLQKQFTRISLLNQITHAVTARQDIDSIILIVLRQLEDHLPIDYGSAYLLDVENNTLQAMVRSDKSRLVADQLQIPSAFPVALTPFGNCLKGQTVYEPDIGRFVLPISARLAQAGYFSVLGTPLIVDEKVFGLLVLVRREKDAFDKAERDFIRDLSAHVAVAIHQAQLYQDLQKAYNDLRQTQQTVMQQERLKALGQMASGIAHDINNALSPIVGFADLITRGQPGLRPDTLKQLAYIRTAGEDIAHIVARLREFYRPRAECESLVMLNLNHLAEQVVDMTRPRWRDIPQSRGVMIEMRAQLDPLIPPLAGIESEFREAITNLVLNAVDALPKGGGITIRTRAAGVQSGDKKDAPPTHAVIEVIDTGSGMDEQTRKRCLEPFFSTKGQRGTGLGLAMVYGVMERHEGRIEVESQPGEGTTMRLIFPVRNIGAGKTAEFDPDTAPGPFNILCVDDEPLLRELVKDMLERDGHQVQTTDGGRAGVEAFRAARQKSEPFDVVITDLGMPYVDGRELATILKSESNETPIVMLTGWGAFMKDDGQMPPHVDGILSKPPRIHEIRSMLDRVVSQKHKVGTNDQPAAHQAIPA